MKKFLKKVLFRLAPDVAERWQNDVQQRHGRNLLIRLGLPEITKRFVNAHGQDILSGPFKGMHYGQHATGSALIPKLVGSYEEEIHKVIEQIIVTPYQQVIDVGCADGYYAVGLALRMPSVRVIAFDTDKVARDLCLLHAEQNQVAQRIEIKGSCDPPALESLLTVRTLILCDCEGYENILLDPEKAPRLQQTDILVELHTDLEMGEDHPLLRRFRKTHDLVLLATQERDPNAYSSLQVLTEPERRLAVSEFRNMTQYFAFLTVRPL